MKMRDDFAPDVSRPVIIWVEFHPEILIDIHICPTDTKKEGRYNIVG